MTRDERPDQLLDQRLVRVVPSERQMAVMDMEFYAFVHFGPNTFTDREWGDGREDPALFDPAALDADQWAETFRAAGMRGLILTCKHHDGFCLWPSRWTDHTVAASPFRGDVVKLVSDACRRAGLRFGVYLSPWDRHEPRYGAGRAYDDFFVGQLAELLTGYGDVCSVWLDGACGEGPNGKRQTYDWPRYHETVRRLQPGACIHVCGPDVRWCGNEAGQTRPSEWSVVPRRTADSETVASASQRADGADFRRRPIRAQDLDLGSRDALRDEPDLIWYPAEVNTSIRPGWFWHPAEDGQVKSLETLIGIYERSVGGNASLLLNVPPTRAGLLHENDAARLRQLGAYLAEAYGGDLAPGGSVSGSAALPGHGPENVLAAGEGYYMPASGTGPWELTLTWPAPVSFRRVVLGEQVRSSQRIERWGLDIWADGGWREAASGTVVGRKRIVTLPGGVRTERLRLRVDDARCAPTVRFVNVYQ